MVGRSLLCLVVFVSAGLGFYSAVYSSHGLLAHLAGEPPIRLAAPTRNNPTTAAPPPPPTNISHILFGIGASARTWPERRGYVELWWRPGVTRGFVWLDEEPSGGGAAWPPSSPPYRLSSNASRFGGRAAAARIANIAAEMYSGDVATGEQGEVRWLALGDDDTVFFPENLASVLGKYDHEQMWYVGASSESVEQDLVHSYDMAFGGGGFALSVPAVAALSASMNSCLERYNFLYGSDERVRACLCEIGVSLTREPGFHQVDLRGDIYGMLAAHPPAALVSLHHLDSVEPITPRSANRLEALGSLVRASRLDPARTLAHTICYEQDRLWSVSVAWGYTVQLYPTLLSAGELETPLRTFTTWRTRQPGPFTFSTRAFPDQPCDQPIIFFLDKVSGDGGATVSEYSVHWRDGDAGACKLKNFAAAAKAPRRQCCEAKVRRPWWNWSPVMEVGIRRCRSGETLAMPPP
ncbi:uncharacterized protein LOC144700624 isoform X2 [Wolffia australiana]